MSHSHDHEAHAAHNAHGDHGDVRNPDYDGPDRHCLPPDAHPSLGSGIVFIALMVALAAGAAWLGVKIL